MQMIQSETTHKSMIANNRRNSGLRYVTIRTELMESLTKNGVPKIVFKCPTNNNP